MFLSIVTVWLYFYFQSEFWCTLLYSKLEMKYKCYNNSMACTSLKNKHGSLT